MLVISGEQKGEGVKGPKKNQGWSRMARRGNRRKAEGSEGVAVRISRAKHSRYQGICMPAMFPNSE